MQITYKFEDDNSSSINSVDEFNVSIQLDNKYLDLSRIIFNFYRFLTKLGFHGVTVNQFIDLSSLCLAEEEEYLEDEENGEDPYKETPSVNNFQDIEELVKDPNSVEQFLIQVNNDSDFLKQVFRAFLKDTLHE